MSAALASVERAGPPDPPQDRPQGTRAAAAPANITRFLRVLRWLISYGTELAGTLQQRARHREFGYFAARFRDTTLSAIAARITRGLLLAGALEAILVERAAKGRDLSIPAVRLPSRRSPSGGAAKRPRAERRVNFVDIPPDRLPTAEEIAAELRRRPLGAILVDICRDLGIRPDDLERAMWDDLLLVVACHGGNLALLSSREDNDMLERIWAGLNPYGTEQPSLAGLQVNAAALGTGPP